MYKKIDVYLRNIYIFQEFSSKIRKRKAGNLDSFFKITYFKKVISTIYKVAYIIKIM